MKEVLSQINKLIASELLRLVQTHPGKVIGVIAGIIIGVIVIILGFWHTVLVMFFVIAGVLWGIIRDENSSISHYFTRFIGNRK